MKKNILGILLIFLYKIMSFILYFFIIHLQLIPILKENNNYNELFIKIINLVLLLILLSFFKKSFQKTFFKTKKIKPVYYRLIIIFIINYMFCDLIIIAAVFGNTIYNNFTFNINYFVTFALLAPLIEELFYRKFLLNYYLNRNNTKIQRFAIILIISVLFAALHRQFEFVLFVDYLIFSIVISYVYYYTKSFITIYLFHSLLNLSLQLKLGSLININFYVLLFFNLIIFILIFIYFKKYKLKYSTRLLSQNE